MRPPDRNWPAMMKRRSRIHPGCLRFSVGTDPLPEAYRQVCRYQNLIFLDLLSQSRQTEFGCNQRNQPATLPVKLGDLDRCLFRTPKLTNGQLFRSP